MRTGRARRAAVVGTLTLLLVVATGGAAAGGAAAVTPPAAPGKGTPAVIARYQDRIPGLMARAGVPGLALAVVDGDRVVWQQGFGTTDGDGSSPVTVDTIFSTQSMSKVFTATAVMRAVQAGLVELDEPITTYLPGFTVHSAFEPHPERRITLRMLLSHTAGFTHEAPLGNNYEPGPGSFDAHVRTISDTWLRFPVGTGYAYSNLGIDLAGYILERVYGQPFPAVMQDLLLGPLGMDRSTFDRARVHATDRRAVGHRDDPVTLRVDSPVTAAGGLWASAADLARFLELQLGDGTVGGHTLLDARLMREMRTVPAPHGGAPAGYALGVETGHWWAGKDLDVFDHGGGGDGFLSDLRWLPQLHLGVAVLTNSEDHSLQGSLAREILYALVTDPDTVYHDRMLAAPTQPEVAQPDNQFLPPADLAARIAAVAQPAPRQQSARWAGYAEYYRAGQPGAMDPTDPASRFHVEAGVPYFDAGEDGTVVRHRLTEFRPGLFLAEDGETLDLRAPTPRWRGLDLNRVTNGPLPWQLGLLAAVMLVSVGWFVAGGLGWVRGRRTGRRGRTAVETGSGPGRRITTTVAVLGALAALVTVTAILALPGLVDVGFLGHMAVPTSLRLAMHLPLMVTILTAGLVALLGAGAARRWWTPLVRLPDAALACALTALTAQLVGWGLVGWGF